MKKRTLPWEMSDNCFKILIVDDQELCRVGLSSALRQAPNIQVLGLAQHGEDALCQVEEYQPDIVLMDIKMPVMDGITATQKIKAKFPQIKVIVLTSSNVEEEVYASFRSGADAFCMKTIKIARLIELMDTISEGAIWIDPAVAKIVADGLRVSQLSSNFNTTHRSPNSSRESSTVLTSREQEVLGHIVCGKSNKEIAATLDITINTVKIHVCNIIHKLSVEDRTQAAVKAIQTGLINPESS